MIGLGTGYANNSPALFLSYVHVDYVHGLKALLVTEARGNDLNRRGSAVNCIRNICRGIRRMQYIRVKGEEGIHTVRLKCRLTHHSARITFSHRTPAAHSRSCTLPLVQPLVCVGKERSRLRRATSVKQPPVSLRRIELGGFDFRRSQGVEGLFRRSGKWLARARFQTG